jgi:hypothetical protein
LARLYVELGVASTTYVHCDITVEADAVVVVDHTVAMFGTLDEFPLTHRHGDSVTAPGCSDADVEVAPTSRLLHRLSICAEHESIPLPVGEPGSCSPAPAPDQEVVTVNARVYNYCNL